MAFLFFFFSEGGGPPSPRLCATGIGRVSGLVYLCYEERQTNDLLLFLVILVNGIPVHGSFYRRHLVGTGGIARKKYYQQFKMPLVL